MRPAGGLALALLLAITGCAKVGEKVMERLAKRDAAAEPAKVEPSASQGGALAAPVVPLDAGVTLAGAEPAPSVTMPDDFPGQVPLYPNARLTAAMLDDKDGHRSHVLLFRTPDRPENVAGFYKQKLKGFRQTVDLTAGAARTLQLASTADKLDVDLVITAAKDHTAVRLAATPRDR